MRSPISYLGSASLQWLYRRFPSTLPHPLRVQSRQESTGNKTPWRKVVAHHDASTRHAQHHLALKSRLKRADLLRARQVSGNAVHKALPQTSKGTEDSVEERHEDRLSTKLLRFFRGGLVSTHAPKTENTSSTQERSKDNSVEETGASSSETLAPVPSPQRDPNLSPEPTNKSKSSESTSSSLFGNSGVNSTSNKVQVRRTMDEAVTAVQKIIGYTFKDPLLLWEALQKNKNGLTQTGEVEHLEGNTRLAMVGDKFLDLVGAEIWWPTQAARSTFQHDYLIEYFSNMALAKKGRDLRIQHWMNRHSPCTENDLATTVEAIVGAVHLDGGSARAVMKNMRLSPTPLFQPPRDMYNVQASSSSHHFNDQGEGITSGSATRNTVAANWESSPGGRREVFEKRIEEKIERFVESTVESKIDAMFRRIGAVSDKPGRV